MGGAAFDPTNGILYLKSNNSPEIDQLKKIDPQESSSTIAAPLHSGRSIYMTYCAGCHGADREGDASLYPSLIGLEQRKTKQQVIERIRQGGGKMPPFAAVIKGKQEENLAAYLLSGSDRKLLHEESDLLEISRNRSALAETSPKRLITDTATTYLNVVAYTPFRGSGNTPGIKPPWGELIAINLSTGDYRWKIPVGNDSIFKSPGGQPTGLTGSPGPIVTGGGLVFIAGGKDRKLHAFDKDNGRLLWAATLPALGSSTPSTYMRGGKQYLVLSVAGDRLHPAGTIMAFTLP